MTETPRRGPAPRRVRYRWAMLAGVWAIYFFFNHGLNNWLPEILRSFGKSAKAAGYWAALPTAVGIAGSLLIPRLATRERRRAILLGLFVCAGVATLLLQVQADVVLAPALILQGIARSSMMTLTILVLMDLPEVGSRHMGAAGGLFFSAAEIGGVAGPLTIGILADHTAGFTAALYLLTAVSIVLLALGLLFRPTTTAPAGRG